MRSFISVLVFGVILTLSARIEATGNIRSNERVFRERMSRWVETIGRESLNHSYSKPIQGRYAFDWEMIISVLNFARSQKSFKLHPQLLMLIREPIFSPDYSPKKQYQWVEVFLAQRKDFFGKAQSRVVLTRETFILAAFGRIDDSLKAFELEVMPTLQWMYVWDAAVEGKRLHELLKLKGTNPWDSVLDEGRKSFARDSQVLGKRIVGTSVNNKITAWLEEARNTSRVHKVTEQNSIAWFLFVREGIESLIVLFCIVGGLGLLQRKWVYGGAVSAVGASFLLFFILRFSVSENPDAEWIRYFVLVNVLLSISLLLFATNFNFHRIYWSAWIAKLRVKSFERGALFAAGFFAIFREGIELGLAMSLISLESGAGSIRMAFLAALPIWILLAICLFIVEKKIPLRSILVGTGALMLLVTVVFAGFATRLLQSFDWLDSTPFVSENNYPLWFENIFAYNGTLESTLMMSGVALILFVPVWGQVIQVLTALPRKVIKNVLAAFSKSTS